MEPYVLASDAHARPARGNDVTDGSVDYYDTDWENVDNSALEEEMQKCGLTPCEGKTVCPDNTPAQTDLSAYEIVSE